MAMVDWGPPKQLADVRMWGRPSSAQPEERTRRKQGWLRETEAREDALAGVAYIGGKRAYGPGSFGSLVPVAEPGSITRDQCRSRFQHEPGLIGLHVDALQRDAPGSMVPVRSTNRDR
jgi:hypothetical protein